ncbi:MAG: MFS transporter [Deltaproteobacteria bacterium]|nr:MFS transporter [Deltaproteobacteria bacterium]
MNETTQEKMDFEPEADNPKIVAAAIWMSVVGTIALLLLPGLVGSFVDYLGFTAQHAGLVASTQLAGTSLGLLFTTVFMVRLNQRTTTLIALIGIIICDILSAAAKGVALLCLLRFFAGAGAGVALGLAIGILSSMRNPDAKFSLAIVAQFAMGGVGIFFLPNLLASIGMGGVFLCIAIISVVGILICPWLTSGPADLGSQEEKLAPLKSLFTGATIIVLLAFFLFYASNGAQWAYLDRIGIGGGLSAEDVGVALSICMIAGILGAMAAAAAAGHGSRRLWLFIGSGLAVLASILLASEFKFTAFCIGACLVNGALSFVVPFYLVTERKEICTVKTGGCSILKG